ncbi:MAG: HEAT repeat domain-containing protein, partial [Verrucomicrobiales bacterium]|nr:HEAT repeat domain-containing protein [Verrucomicrobiales bacterium]
MSKIAKRNLGLALGLAALALAALFGWLARPTPPRRGSLAELRELCARAYAADTNAAFALQVRGSNAVPGLLVLLHARDPWWREKIWQWLPKLPLRWSVRIAQRVGSPTATLTREAAARGLGLLGTNAAAAAPELARALRDPQGRIRQEAALALLRIGPAAVPHLTDALRDGSPQVRQAAAFALGEIGPAARAAVPMLAHRLGDGDEWVRRTCAGTLARLGLD